MIASGYCLDLYCDTPNCPTSCAGGSFQPTQFTDELGSKCRAAARRRGWKFGRDGLPDLCPTCARAATTTKPKTTRAAKPPRRGGLSDAAELFEQQAQGTKRRTPRTP